MIDIKETENTYQIIIDLVARQEVKESLDYLQRMIIQTRNGDFMEEFLRIDATYRNILKYTIEGVDDPERPKIYDRMLAGILDLCDRVKQFIYTQWSGMQIYRMKYDFEKQLGLVKERAVESVSGLSFTYELDDILRDIDLKKEETLHDQSERDKVLTNIFNLIWLTDKFLETDIRLVHTIRQSDNIPWYEKCIVVSALTLSLIRCFDRTKIELLLDFYQDGIEQVWHRALVGLILAFFIHDRRLFIYPDITARIKELGHREKASKDIEMVIIQLMRSNETEKITKKLQEEILPEMMKMAPKIEEKLDLDSILPKDFHEDKNPDWEEFFKDTPDLYEKMEEFTHLQMEGSDVFWSAFAALKHFDFFKTIHNWFLPFNNDNSVVREIFRDEKQNVDPELFMDGIMKMPYLCNSDKFSFCLNISHLQQNQKALLMDFFNAELENLSEITDEDNLLNTHSKDKFIFTQYIQDLYRFFKLHPLKNEFTDIFNLIIDIHKSWFFNNLIGDPSTMRNIAEFYFEKDHYRQAFEIYSLLNEKGDNSYEIYEKMGYCSQRTGEYDQALDYYRKAELFDTPRPWLLKKIGLCYRNLKRYEEAIGYYEQVLASEPENMNIQTVIGQCYLELGEYEKALERFYRVELLSSSSIRSLRPIAWISFILGKFDDARKYYEEIIAKEPNKYDYMNLGHVEWCLGHKPRAIELYKTSIQQKDNTAERFMAGFMDDRKYLINHGITEDEIHLMLDYLKYTLEPGTT